MLTTYETILAIFSAAGAVLLGPLLIVLVIAAWRRRVKRRDHAYLKRELAKMDLTLEGYKVKLDLPSGEVLLIVHPDPHIKQKLGVERGWSDKDICPSFDSQFKVFGSKKLLANLRADPSRLIPFFDFVMAWSKEVEIDHINKDRAWLKFRDGNKDPASVPVDLLPDLLKDASVAFRAFFQAATTPSSPSKKRETAFPRWLFDIRRLIDNRFLVLLLSLVAAMISAGLLTNHFYSTMKDRQAMSWPSVKGKMITSKVIHRTQTTGRLSDKRTSHSYHADLAYRYTVNNQTYVRHRYSFYRKSVGGEVDSYNVTSDHPKDSTVRVYYNPNEPGTSIIRRHGKKPKVLYLILWTLAYLPSLLILALFLLLGSIVQGARRRLRERGERDKSLSPANKKASPKRATGADTKKKTSPQATDDSDSDSDSTMAKELFKELKQGGLHKGRGEFTLERGEARKKLSRYQLADPHEFVLELVQAAVLKGSTFVDVRVRAHAVDLRFDGRPFGFKELDSLYDLDPAAASADADVRARQQLALGLVAAERLEPRQIQLRSGDETGVSELHRQTDEPDRVRTLEGDSANNLHPATTTLHFQFARRRKSSSLRPVADHLRRACLYAEIPIRLNGKRVSEGLHVRQDLAAVAKTSIQGTGLGGELGFTPLGDGATVYLIQNGVLLSELPLKDQEPELVAVVRAENLHLDLSLRKFVHDDAMTAAQKAIVQARKRAKSKHDIPALLSAAQKPIVAAEIKRIKRYTRLTVMSAIVPFICGTACAILGSFIRFIATDKDHQILLTILLWVVGLLSFAATVVLPWILINRGHDATGTRIPPKSAAGRKVEHRME